MKKKSMLLCICLLIMSVLLSGITVFAAANDKIPNGQETISDFLGNRFELKPDFGKTVQLLDLSGKQTFTYYEFTTDDGTGYAIYDKILDKITEFASDHTLSLELTEKTMYGGPAVMYEIVENSGVFDSVGNSVQLNFVRDLRNQKNIPCSQGELNKMAQSQEQIRANSANSVNKSDSAESIAYPLIKKLPGADAAGWLYLAGQYHGDCGVNAIAMMEKYYDLYLNSNTLPVGLTGEKQMKGSVVAYIITSTNYNSVAMTMSDMSAVMSGHVNSVGSVTMNSTFGAFSWNTVYNKLSSNRPVLVGVLSHPTYGNHAVVACGYMVDNDPGLNMLYINDGWGNYCFVDPAYAFEYAMFTQ